MVPTEEEISGIQDALQESPDVPLGSAEQFLLTLSSISDLEARLNLWAFKLDYDVLEKVHLTTVCRFRRPFVEFLGTFRLTLVVKTRILHTLLPGFCFQTESFGIFQIRQKRILCALISHRGTPFIFQEVAEPLQDLRDAVKEIKSSVTLKRILATLKAIGNLLNNTKVCQFCARLIFASSTARFAFFCLREIYALLQEFSNAVLEV